MKREIFRAAALARMSSPEQLDQLMRVTSMRSWIALLAVFLILATAVVWGFQGRLAEKSDGKGVVIRAGNLVTVGTLGSGRITKVAYKSGDHVNVGDVVGLLAQPSIEDKIRAAQAELADAQRERVRQKSVRTAGLEVEDQSIARQREAIEQQIKTLRDQAKTVADQIPVQEELFSKGLVTRQQIYSLKERQSSIENNISSLRAQEVQLNSSRFRSTSQNEQSDVEFGGHIAQLERNLRLLENDLVLNTKIVSPYAGQVVEVQSPAGSLVGPGTTILTLQPDVQDLEVVAYVPSVKAKEVEPGMDAQLVPSSVRPEEFGFMRGKVVSISEYPATDNAIQRTFQNSSLAQAVSGGPVNEVRISLLKDPATPSGYKWSSSKGAPIKITPATICTVQIVTREQAPITLVLPYIKKQLGVY